MFHPPNTQLMAGKQSSSSPARGGGFLAISHLMSNMLSCLYTGFLEEVFGLWDNIPGSTADVDFPSYQLTTDKYFLPVFLHHPSCCCDWGRGKPPLFQVLLQLCSQMPKQMGFCQGTAASAQGDLCQVCSHLQKFLRHTLWILTTENLHTGKTKHCWAELAQPMPEFPDLRFPAGRGLCSQRWWVFGIQHTLDTDDTVGAGAHHHAKHSHVPDSSIFSFYFLG